MIKDNPARAKLLLVDDQAVNIQILFAVFGDEYEVFIATTGQEALRISKTSLPDLILMDIVMPDIGGLEVCRLLKADPETSEIPVIFVTSQNHPEEETAGLDAGAVDFISKPVNGAVVRARVKTHLKLKQQSDLLRSLSFVDGLTGLWNRRRFDESLEAEWSRCARTSSPLTVFMIDVDHFKKYNDALGHLAGDVCLKVIAKVLQESVRRSHDVVARYGGEEFACLIPYASEKDAVEIARKTVQAVFDLGLEHPKSETAPVVTISLGLAFDVPKPDGRAKDLLALADARLYQAKHTGRNRFSGPSAP